MYLADTNIYIEAANLPPFQTEFSAFLGRWGPLAVSSVVIAEVLLGIPRFALHAAAARALSGADAPLAPTQEDWRSAAGALVRMREAGKSRSFWNDALLAAQCARLGLTLITRNQADFRRLKRELGVAFVAPFPR